MNNRHFNSLLVTGGAGFVGANFVHYWREQYPLDKIVVLDALTYAGNLKNLSALQNQEGFFFVKGDICDSDLVEKLLREHWVDTLVHFAAESHVDRSIVGPDTFIETNILGTHSLLKAAKKVWLDEAAMLPHRFHHVSTDEVYGALAPNAPAFCEDTPYAPNSPYAASKASSDHLVRAYHHTYGLQATTSNCSNNYGPYQFPEKLIPLVITHILCNKALPIYGDGKQIRDWLFVEDHVRGIERVLKDGRVGESYNVGGHNDWANIDLVLLVCSLLDEAFQLNGGLKLKYPKALAAIAANSQSLIGYVKDRPGHDRRYAINSSKAIKELGYKPQESFESGMRLTLTWYLENDDWWKAIMNGSYRSREQRAAN